MNLRSLFQRLMPPKKAGNSGPQTLKRVSATSFFLEVTNLQDRPSYPLGDHFTVGSEIGELVLDHPSLSPRHGTFYFKNGVVTYMDHASTQGSSLNSAPLPQGRAVILEVGDEVLLGEVAIKLLAEEREMEPPSLPEIEEVPELVEVPEPEEVIEKVISPLASRDVMEQRLREVRTKKAAASPLICVYRN